MSEDDGNLDMSKCEENGDIVEMNKSDDIHRRQHGYEYE